MFFFFFLIIFRNKYPNGKKGVFWILFLGASLFEMMFYNGRLLLLILSLVVFSSYQTDMTRMIRTHIKAILTGVIFVVLCSLVGILEVQGVAKALDNVTGFLFRPNNVRYNLGFTHFNVVPIDILFIYLYVVILKRDNYKRSWDLIAFSINYGVYLLCGSRSCIVLLIMAIILRNIIRNHPSWFLKTGVPASVVFLVGILFFSFILPASDAFYHPLVQRINLLLSARLTLIRKILQMYPLNLWGYGEVTFDNSATEYLALDNGYVTLLVTRGIIIGLLFLILIVSMILHAKRMNNAYELLFMIIVIIGNVIDNSLLHYISFPMYIMVFNEFVGDQERKAVFRKIKNIGSVSNECIG